MKSLSLLPFAFWRFARLPYERFRFAEFASHADLLDGARSAITDTDEVRERLVVLLRRPSDYFVRVARTASRSESRRALAYIADALVSLVARHDLGVKGGVSVSLSDVKGPVATHPPPIPARIDDVRVVLADAPSAWARQRESRREFEICVDSPYTWAPTADEVATATAMLSRIAEVAITLWPAHLRPALLFLAVDAMRTANGLDFFEVHVPGRSLGAHLLPCLWSGNRPLALAVGAFIGEMHRGRGSYTVDEVAARDTFALLDDECLRWIASSMEGGREGPAIPLLAEFPNRRTFDDGVPQEFVKLLDREMWNIVTSRNQASDSRTVRRGDRRGLVATCEELGPWIVLKQRINLPWWHKRRARVMITLTSNESVNRHVDALLSAHDLVVERLNVSSRDTRGRTGEFRWFACVPL